MKRAAAKIITKLQNFEQKQLRMVISQEMLTTFNYNPERSQLVTNHGCVVMTLKPKPNHTNGSVLKTKKSLQVRSDLKVLLNVVFDYNGVVHHELLHKVVRSIRNTTLKLYDDCAKRNRQKRTELLKNQS